MGLFDFFKRSGSDGPPSESALRKHAARVANKRAQGPDRWDSIQALARMGTPEAVEGLLARFGYQTDPSITDQEEKDAAFEAIIETGPKAIEPVKQALRTAETIAWPLKMLDRLLEPDEVITELIGALSTMHLEYERDPERKLSLLSTLEERRDPRIIEAAARFLDDVNETARFYAAGAIYAQGDADAVRPALLVALGREESARTRTRILEGFASRGWDVGELREKLAKQLPAGFSIDAKGVVSKK